MKIREKAAKDARVEEKRRLNAERQARFRKKKRVNSKKVEDAGKPKNKVRTLAYSSGCRTKHFSRLSWLLILFDMSYRTLRRPLDRKDQNGSRSAMERRVEQCRSGTSARTGIIHSCGTI